MLSKKIVGLYLANIRDYKNNGDSSTKGVEYKPKNKDGNTNSNNNKKPVKRIIYTNA